jgi:DNA-binding CsgD family transcriptional regulator
MLSSFYLDTAGSGVERTDLSEGVAFLKSVSVLYELASASYACLNLRHGKREGCYIHNNFSNRKIRQRTSGQPLSLKKLERLGLTASAIVDWRQAERLSIELDLRGAEAGYQSGTLQGLSFLLDPLTDETAVFALSLKCDARTWSERRDHLADELRILAEYFHSHMLRLNGYDTNERLLISARELDCLKCTAEGKTALEASKLLGISERTVRFHLNSAREKMKCANTTEAVARAVGMRMITLSRR